MSNKNLKLPYFPMKCMGNDLFTLNFQVFMEGAVLFEKLDNRVIMVDMEVQKSISGKEKQRI